MKMVPVLAGVLTAIALQPAPILADSAAEISRNAKSALNTLYAENSAARAVGKQARSLSTTTLGKGIYVFFFGQKGLMGGFGLQGTKITRYAQGVQMGAGPCPNHLSPLTS